MGAAPGNTLLNIQNNQPMLRNTAATLLLSLLLSAPPLTGCTRQGWSQGTYIWDSRALLNSSERPQELDRLRQQGMTHLLVGLSAAQVNDPDSPAALRALVRQAHARNQKVVLLLGDPAWINPRDRLQLVALIRRFRRMPFDGLHLDLEVEQLGWPVPATRLQHWLDTLRAAAAVSPWPLSISSHPRWFEPAANESAVPADPCVPCELQGVSAVNLMLYSRNASRVSERTRAIAQRWPQLHFRLAQSVEAGLEPGLSWAGSSVGTLHSQMQRWRSELAPDGIGGVDWQDWASYPKEP